MRPGIGWGGAPVGREVDLQPDPPRRPSRMQAAPAAAFGLGLYPALRPDRAQWWPHSALPCSPPKADIPGSRRRHAHGVSCSRAEAPGAAVWLRGPAKAYSAAYLPQAPSPSSMVRLSSSSRRTSKPTWPGHPRTQTHAAHSAR